MHIATRLYEGLVARCSDILLNDLKFTRDALQGRQRQLIRLAALLHDIGHPPFSHAAEELMPRRDDQKKYAHEDYTVAILQYAMRDIIENHPYNRKNYGLTVQDITDIFQDTPKGQNLLWKELISSQLDADRMDYMLRDSHHAGVAYGRYDLDRIAATIALVVLPDEGSYTIGIGSDGIHAAEGLLIARYMLFTQVYFHKTRVIYDHHLKEALAELLRDCGGSFSPPDNHEGVQAFLGWDDWKVYGSLGRDLAGAHGKILYERDHYRLLRETPEVPALEDLEKMDSLEERLTGETIKFARINAGKSWYKMGSDHEIYIRPDGAALHKNAQPLSSLSSAIKGLAAVRQNRIYVAKEDRQRAESLAKSLKAE